MALRGQKVLSTNHLEDSDIVTKSRLADLTGPLWPYRSWICEAHWQSVAEHPGATYGAPQLTRNWYSVIIRCDFDTYDISALMHVNTRYICRLLLSAQPIVGMQVPEGRVSSPLRAIFFLTETIIQWLRKSEICRTLRFVVNRPRYGCKTYARRMRDALETAYDTQGETPGETSYTYKYEAGPSVY